MCPSPPEPSSPKRQRSVFEELFDKIDNSSPDSKHRKLQTENLRIEELSTESTPLQRVDLTTENLRVHTKLEGTAISETMPPKGTTQTPANSTTTEYDDQATLEQYGIVLDSHAKMPRELVDHIEQIIERERPGDSPSAKRLHDMEPFATISSESAALDIIIRDLMFPDRRHDPQAPANICLVNETYFDRQYVKHPADGRDLRQARPDRVNAYMPSRNVKGLVDVPFTRDEEAILNEGNLHPDVYAPWLTGQFKNASLGHSVAMKQGARDATAVQNWHFRFFNRADMNPTVVDTVHWSITCNTEGVKLSCHWYSSDHQYHMTEHSRASLRGTHWKLERNEDMARMRKYLRNLLEWAQTERLNRIREVIAAIRTRRANAAKEAKEDAEKKVGSQAGEQRASKSSRTVGFAESPTPRSGEAFGTNRQHYTSPSNTSDQSRRPYKKSKTRRDNSQEYDGSIK
jgi:hypothetical protein